MRRDDYPTIQTPGSGAVNRPCPISQFGARGKGDDSIRQHSQNWARREPNSPCNGRRSLPTCSFLPSYCAPQKHDKRRYVTSIYGQELGTSILT
jgi:hypothetical protein